MTGWAIAVLAVTSLYECLRAMWWRSEAKYWERRTTEERGRAENWRHAYIRLASKDK